MRKYVEIQEFKKENHKREVLHFISLSTKIYIYTYIHIFFFFFSKSQYRLLRVIFQLRTLFVGTGTVSIVVSDINDMPPVFTKEEWLTEVNESSHTPQAAILTVTVIDRDETNDFYYKASLQLHNHTHPSTIFDFNSHKTNNIIVSKVFVFVAYDRNLI